VRHLISRQIASLYYAVPPGCGAVLLRSIRIYPRIRYSTDARSCGGGTPSSCAAAVISSAEGAQHYQAGRRRVYRTAWRARSMRKLAEPLRPDTVREKDSSDSPGSSSSESCRSRYPTLKGGAGLRTPSCKPLNRHPVVSAAWGRGRAPTGVWMGSVSGVRGWVRAVDICSCEWFAAASSPG
jgi:hypothetical protein